MAFVASNPTSLAPVAFSLGPVKLEIQSFTCASGDTSGTITATKLSRIDLVDVGALGITAAPTISGNTVTIAFTDPAANRAGIIYLYGR